MTTYRYSVHKIRTFPLAKFAFMLGGVAMFLPGLLCAFLSTQLIALLRIFLEQWETVRKELFGIGAIEFDFINLLGLENVHNTLIMLSDQSLVVALLVFLINIVIGGLILAFTILLVGWSYNILAVLTGGLEIELREKF